ncbi:MAG: IS30 family transposase, partial [Actinobacteria bacterium]|nr:IS30 family transposase [Actinomycetota bacterium]
AQHARFKTETGVPVYFCDPQSPWQRGTNENTNGLLRQYWPKGADLRHLTMAECDQVALQLNTRPRKTLEWQTPGQALNQRLVATAD